MVQSICSRYSCILENFFVRVAGSPRATDSPVLANVFLCSFGMNGFLKILISRKKCRGRNPKMSGEEKCKTLNGNHDMDARVFQHQLEKYFEIILKSLQNIIEGRLKFYGIKIEFYIRGSPHAHMSLWAEPDLKLTKQNNGTV